MKPTINQTNMELAFKFIAERHLIYKRRFIYKSKYPFTKDSILQKFKFTNIFRFLDPGTKFVIDHIIPNCAGPEEVIFNCIIYRLYNKISTFQHVGLQTINAFDKDLFAWKLRELALDEPVFTNAFIVAGYNWVDPERDKIANTSTLLSWVHRDISSITKSLMTAPSSQKTYQNLLSIKGLGEFLAYQIAVDLGYWNKSVFNEDKFTVAGPGCKRGIDRVYSDKGDFSYEQLIQYTCDIQDEWFAKIGIDPAQLFDDQQNKRLNLMAMENCFCEISKYLKAYYGEGRPRNYWRPPVRKSKALLDLV